MSGGRIRHDGAEKNSGYIAQAEKFGAALAAMRLMDELYAEVGTVEGKSVGRFRFVGAAGMGGGAMPPTVQRPLRG